MHLNEQLFDMCLYMCVYFLTLGFASQSYLAHPDGNAGGDHE